MSANLPKEEPMSAAKESFNEECCTNCRFFSENSKYGGSCRRYPPQFYSEFDPQIGHPTLGTGYPFMQHDQWCGEFQREQ